MRPSGGGANAVDLSGHHLEGWFWRKIWCKLATVLVESRDENCYNSWMKRAVRPVGYGRKKVQKISQKEIAMAQNVREICGPNHRIS